jgi:hypothetical protein
MIVINPEGNTTIRIATSGTELGDKWTVYPYVDKDPTLQRFDSEKVTLIKELSITEFREKDDLTGKKEQEQMAESVARLLRNINEPLSEELRGLGLKVHQIDIDPEGSVAKILEERYEIKGLSPEGLVKGEAKA